MYVEDFLIAISEKCAALKQRRRPSAPAFGGMFNGEWYCSFISSMTQHVQAERALSSNQSRMILKMIKNARHYIVEYGIASQSEVDAMLAAPQHRHLPYVSSQVPREARYAGDNLLALRCKADSTVTADIKALGKLNQSFITVNLLRMLPRFDWRHKLWIVPVHRFNLRAVNVLLRAHRFRCDRLTTAYLETCAHKYHQPAIFTFADPAQATMVVNVADDYILAGWIIDVASGIVL